MADGIDPLAADLAGVISEALTGALSDDGSVRGDVLRWAARAGVLAGGAVAGVAVRRYAKRRAATRAGLEGPAVDPLAAEEFGILRCPPTPVRADDGVPLWVEVCDPPGGLADDAPVLVFIPGFCLTLDAWHFQRRDLREAGRLVFYDQRGHGRSGRGVRGRATIEQLALDLRRVVDVADPPGPDGAGRPVVLVGHSLGGMVVLAFAAAYPELMGPRVVGAALLATSPGRLAEVTLGLPAALARVLWPRASSVVGRVATRPAMVERGLRADRDVGLWLTKRLSFGPGGVSPALARFTGAMLNSTRLDVFAEFFPEFGRHDKEAALPAFRAVQTVVVAGGHDLMTPADHSRAMAAVLPAAELTVLADAGHLLPLERPDEVNDILRRLVERVRLADQVSADRVSGGEPRSGGGGAVPEHMRIRAVTDPSAEAPPAAGWDDLQARMRGCLACGELAARRIQVVPGECPPGAELLLLGEAPGATEDAEGLPFVGRSGAVLDAVLAEAGLARASVAVVNVLKCRPPDNRAPTRQEAANCRPWLDRQLALADPLLVVTLGLTAAVWALGRGITLTGVRGRLHSLGCAAQGRPGPWPLLPTYHPSAALRFGPRGTPRAAMVDDLVLARDLLPELRARRAAGPGRDDGRPLGAPAEGELW